MPPLSERLPFRGFDLHGEVAIHYTRNLPHWRQEGCTYFVTFRLADSLPQVVFDEIRFEEERLRIRLGSSPDFSVSLDHARKIRAKFEKALDKGTGKCILRCDEMREVVVDSLYFFDGDRCAVGDLVVMPNHVHVLMAPFAGCTLDQVLSSVKGFSGKRIRELSGGDGAVWQRSFYDHIVRDREQLGAVQRYIRRNPEKAGLRAGEFTLRTAEYEG